MSQVGIYRLYKLGRLSGSTFSKDIKVLERDLHAIHHNYADRINGQSEINGLLYELDEKATKLYWDKKPYKQVKEYTEFEEVAEKPAKEDKKAELNRLRAEYEELTGEKPHQLLKAEKLIEKIEEFKTK